MLELTVTSVSVGLTVSPNEDQIDVTAGPRALLDQVVSVVELANMATKVHPPVADSMSQ